MAAIAPRLLETERILEGTLSYVESATSRTATTARDRVSARLATADERQLLQLPDPCAVIVTHHTVVDAADLVLDFSESVGPPDSWSVEHEYPIGR
jgi:GntR family transcriptional regulator